MFLPLAMIGYLSNCRESLLSNSIVYFGIRYILIPEHTISISESRAYFFRSCNSVVMTIFNSYLGR
jgi:hypothetical protein